VASVTETIQLKGITCGRCVMRLRHVLKDHDGLEAANANLMGQLTVTYDDARTSRDALLKDVARGGFRELDETDAPAKPARPFDGAASGASA
jgi:copper chaperone